MQTSHSLPLCSNFTPQPVHLLLLFVISHYSDIAAKQVLNYCLTYPQELDESWCSMRTIGIHYKEYWIKQTVRIADLPFLTRRNCVRVCVWNRLFRNVRFNILRDSLNVLLRSIFGLRIVSSDIDMFTFKKEKYSFWTYLLFIWT